MCLSVHRRAVAAAGKVLVLASDERTTSTLCDRFEGSSENDITDLRSAFVDTRQRIVRISGQRGGIAKEENRHAR